MINLGWANGWKNDPEIVQKCKKLNHHRSDVDEGPPMRGIQQHVMCKICNYEYYYDSSD